MSTAGEVEEVWMQQHFFQLGMVELTTKLWSFPGEVEEYRRCAHYSASSGIMMRNALDKCYDDLFSQITETWDKSLNCRKFFLDYIESDDVDEENMVSAARKLYVYCSDLMRVCELLVDDIEEIKEKLDES